MPWNDAKLYCQWMKWPSYSVDTRYTPLESSERDETLIRVISQLSFSTRLGVAATAVGKVTFGLIAWDDAAAIPDAFEIGLAQGIPSPDFGVDDWILRVPVCLTQPNGVTGIMTYPMQAPTFTESRAMRKLPPKTGILAVLSMQSQAEYGTVLSWFWDVRMAVKAPK